MKYLLLCLTLSCATVSGTYVTSPDQAADIGRQFEAVELVLKDKQLTLEQSAEWQRYSEKFTHVYSLSAEVYKTCAITNDDKLCDSALDMVGILVPELHKFAELAGITLPGMSDGK